jgi:hypothetical protein
VDGHRSARHRVSLPLPCASMALVHDRPPRPPQVDVPLVVEVDEGEARRALRGQIARLERQLADAFVSGFPRTPIDVRVPTSGGPRMLSLGELEAHRDALQERLRAARCALAAAGEEIEHNRVLLERMLLQPRRYKFARLHRADVGMGGCGAYEVRPRLGIIGMMLGWWQVKLSSGCPLAT